MSDTLSQPGTVASYPLSMETAPAEHDADSKLEIYQAERETPDVADGRVHKSKWEELGSAATIKLFWRASLVCFAVAFSAATDGYQIGLAGNIIANQGFIGQFATQVDSAGNPVIAAQVFAIWGPLGSVGQWCGMNISPFIADSFGRRAAMFSYWASLAISVTIECNAKTWGVWAVAKVFSLLGVGAMQAMLQTYIYEMSPTNRVRGAMLACYSLWWSLGSFLGPLALKIMNDRSPHIWTTPIYTQWAQIGIMFIVYSFVPESPWWLAMKGRDEDAKKVLRRLNGKIDGYNVEEEYAILARTVKYETEIARIHNQSKWTEVFTGINGWRTFAASWTLVCQMFLGLGLIYTYVTYFFELAGETDPFKGTAITSSLGVIAVVVAVCGLDKIGRRPLVLATQWGCWICLLIIGCVSLVKQNDATKNVLLAFACIWSFSMNLNGAVAWPYVGEIASSRLRSRTSGVSASISVTVGIITGVLVPYMINVNDWNWGLKSCFFFVGVSFPMIIATYFIVPETKGRSPAELDEMFENKVPAWRMRSYVTQVQNTGLAADATTMEEKA